jgi:sorting nexin-1/2
MSASCIGCVSCHDDYCTTCLELATSTSSLARSTALLANMEEHTGLSRVLSQLAEVEEKLESYHQDQADRDYFVLSELAKDYVGLMGAVKVRVSQRVFTIKWHA